MSFFSVSDLTAGYDNQTVIDQVSFCVERGCMIGILGANGSGKTTLLKAICGILPHTGNCILDHCLLENLSVRQLSRYCSYIPQRSGISIDISALDVVLMGFNPRLGILEHPTKAMEDAAFQALSQVGLAQQAQTNYLHLSEGQKQLCILARTLIAGSKLLLLDEPESALDFHHRYQMLEILRNWIKAEEKAAIVTLHDPSLALNYCDQLLLLEKGSVVGTLYPKSDSLERMEQLLTSIYGPINLQVCRTPNGHSQIVLLKENVL